MPVNDTAAAYTWRVYFFEHYRKRHRMLLRVDIGYYMKNCNSIVGMKSLSFFFFLFCWNVGEYAAAHQEFVTLVLRLDFFLLQVPSARASEVRTSLIRRVTRKEVDAHAHAHASLQPTLINNMSLLVHA